MWIYLPEAFLSIVDPDGSYDGSTGPQGKKLLVRARFAGDIERVFPGARVTKTPDRDYLFRALIDRNTVADVMAAQVMGISAKNFKGSVRSNERHDTYMKVWAVMDRAQRDTSCAGRNTRRKHFV